MKKDGEYAYIKTYPMCRWSGQLGPKKREGDRQVPEGFYAITPAQMNPNSAYYLSFNVGYPNAYDRAHGYTGGNIMVHGVCSSAGCFSMTDEQIAEIYAIAREAFAGGQRQIQLQSMPFRMTPENLAKYRLDPNMPFWKSIKAGYDSFEVTHREPVVGVCGKRYVFNAVPANGGRLDANAACPPLKEDEALKSATAQKDHEDEIKVAELVAHGVKPIRTVYADGGQNAIFANVMMVSRPEALAQGPREIELDDKGRPVPALVQIAAAKEPARPAVAPAKGAAPAKAPPTAANGKSSETTIASAPAPVQAAASKPDAPFAGIVSSFASISDLISGKRSAKPAEQAAAAIAAPPAPAAQNDVKKPAPAKKTVSRPVKPQASLAPSKSQKQAEKSPFVQVGSMTYARAPSPVSLR
jgi:murein L,D-transpeptidase YafK